MSIKSSAKKIELIKEEIDTITDLNKLKSYAEARVNEYKDASLSSIASKAGLVIAQSPQGAGAVATAISLQAKVLMSTAADVAEKATVLALLTQKIQQLTQEINKQKIS